MNNEVTKSEVGMLWTIVVILTILGLLAAVSAYRLFGFVYPMMAVERLVLYLDRITGHKLHLGEHIFDHERAH